MKTDRVNLVIVAAAIAIIAATVAVFYGKPSVQKYNFNKPPSPPTTHEVIDKLYQFSGKPSGATIVADNAGSPFPWAESDGSINPYSGETLSADFPLNASDPIEKISDYLQKLGFSPNGRNTYSESLAAGINYQRGYEFGGLKCVLLYYTDIDNRFSGPVLLECGTFDSSLPEQYKEAYGDLFEAVYDANKPGFTDVAFAYALNNYLLGTESFFNSNTIHYFLAKEVNGRWYRIPSITEDEYCHTLLGNSIPVSLWDKYDSGDHCVIKSGSTTEIQAVHYREYAEDYFNQSEKDGSISSNYQDVFSTTTLTSWINTR